MSIPHSLTFHVDGAASPAHRHDHVPIVFPEQGQMVIGGDGRPGNTVDVVIDRLR